MELHSRCMTPGRSPCLSEFSLLKGLRIQTSQVFVLMKRIRDVKCLAIVGSQFPLASLSYVDSELMVLKACY